MQLIFIISSLIVISILFIVSAITEVFVDDFMNAHTLYSYLLFSTVIAALLSTYILDYIDFDIYYN